MFALSAAVYAIRQYCIHYRSSLVVNTIKLHRRCTKFYIMVMLTSSSRLGCDRNGVIS